MNTCLHCGKETTNPKFCCKSCSATYTNARRAPRTEESRKKTSEAIKALGVRGKRICHLSQCIVCNKMFEGYRKTCSTKCYHNFMKINAHNNLLGSIGQRQGKTEQVKDSYGNIARLESSYESKFANILNMLSLKWIRPKPLFWVDENQNKHKYFPDFYLPEHNIYFDPKNDYLIKVDNDKISRVSMQNNIKLFVVSFENINKNYVTAIVEQNGIEPFPVVFQTTEQTTYSIAQQSQL
jgi:hypothetical protein